MRTAYLTGIRKMEVRQQPDPRPVRADEVLLKIDTVGVCGSDLHYYRDGRIGAQVVEFPWVVGHECAGVVAAAGAEVRNLRVGNRVAVDPLIACGRCDQCRSGREHTCRDQAFLGVPGQLPGSMSDYLVMPARCCLPIPAAMSFDQAVLAEPFAIALWAVKLAASACSEGVSPASRQVGVLGSGPIGLCVIAALRTLATAGAPDVIYATDLLDERVALARRMGADWSTNALREDVSAAIGRRQPLGLDVVFECAGKQETLDQAAELLGPGGLLVIVGIPETNRISFDMNHLRRKELRVQNVRRQNGCAAAAIELLGSRRVNLDPLVTHHFGLEQSQEAFDLVADYRDGVVKAMIRM